jgi:hypothetical protein
MGVIYIGCFFLFYQKTLARKRKFENVRYIRTVEEVHKERGRKGEL